MTQPAQPYEFDDPDHRCPGCNTVTFTPSTCVDCTLVYVAEDYDELRVAARALLDALPERPWSERTTRAVKQLERMVRS